jgi:hypothetical protein
MKMIGHEPMAVEAVVTHCANPKCMMGAKRVCPPRLIITA